MSEQILAFLDDQHDLVIELQKEMTARPALCPTSGGQGEKDKADYQGHEYGGDLKIAGRPDKYGKFSTLCR